MSGGIDTTSLVLRRDYLVGQRRLIITRAVLASLAGAIPVPVLDDWLVATILGGGYRRIAAAHQVDIDPAAVKNLVHGTSRPPSLVDMATSGIVYRVATRAALGCGDNWRQQARSRGLQTSK